MGVSDFQKKSTPSFLASQTVNINVNVNVNKNVDTNVNEHVKRNVNKDVNRTVSRGLITFRSRYLPPASPSVSRHGASLQVSTEAARN